MTSESTPVLGPCFHAWLCLALTALALLVSVCLNVILCFLRRRDTTHRDTETLLYPQVYERQRSEDEERHDDDDDHHHGQQENPIYGNICMDRGDDEEVCYEMMTKQRMKNGRKAAAGMKPLQPDLNYASLDLNVAEKRKKKCRYPQGQTQAQSQLQARLSQPLANPTAPMAVFLEVEAEVEASLPSRNSSPMASRSSIYLNSQQIALETEEREREKHMNVAREEMGWDGIREWERGCVQGWEGEREDEDKGEIGREDSDKADTSTQMVEVEAIHDDSGHFISSINLDNEQQD